MDMKTFFKALLLGFFFVGVAPVHAAQPGRGETAELERSYLRNIIDHHFSGLRMTELAAGTLEQVRGDISPDDRTRPSPGFEEGTEPQASLDEIKSLARKDNRVQREEILKARRLLMEWYGETYEPSLTPQMRAEIERLEGVRGEEFDRLFLQIFPHHHYEAVIMSVDCLSGYDIEHRELHRYCEGIANRQLGDIDEMRDIACHHYGMCDIQAQEHNELQGHAAPAGRVEPDADASQG